MEKIKDVVEEVVNEMDMVEDVVKPAVSRSGLKGKVIGVGGIVVAGLATLAIKNKAKLKAHDEKRLIKKLEKRGYTVSMSDPDMEMKNYTYDDVEDDFADK